MILEDCVFTVNGWDWFAFLPENDYFAEPQLYSQPQLQCKDFTVA